MPEKFRFSRKMCGRTACTLAPDEVSRACSYRSRGGRRRQPRWKDGDADKYRPSYNKSPQSMSPVLLSQRHFDEVRTTLSVQLCVYSTIQCSNTALALKEWTTDENHKHFCHCLNIVEHCTPNKAFTARFLRWIALYGVGAHVFMFTSC